MKVYVIFASLYVYVMNNEKNLTSHNFTVDIARSYLSCSIHERK